MPNIENTQQGGLNFGQPSEEKHFMRDYSDEQRKNLAAEILRKGKEGLKLSEEEEKYKKWLAEL